MVETRTKVARPIFYLVHDQRSAINLARKQVFVKSGEKRTESMFILRMVSLILSVSCVTSAAIPDGQVVGSYQVRLSAACEIEADLSAGEMIEDNMVETGAAAGGGVVVVVEEESMGEMDDASARARNETFSGASINCVSWSECDAVLRESSTHPGHRRSGKGKERERERESAH